MKLGKLTEEEAEQWRQLLQAAKTPDSTVTNLAVVANYAYLDIAVMLDIWNFWELSEVFDAGKQKERAVPLSALAATLAINRCVDPASKSRTTVWFRQTALPFLLKTIRLNRKWNFQMKKVHKISQKYLRIDLK